MMRFILLVWQICGSVTFGVIVNQDTITKLLNTEYQLLDSILVHPGEQEYPSSELVPRVAEVTLSEREDLRGLDREHKDRIW